MYWSNYRPVEVTDKTALAVIKGNIQQESNFRPKGMRVGYSMMMPERWLRTYPVTSTSLLWIGPVL